MDLFSAGSSAVRSDAPLAARMRPRALAEIVGQEQVLKAGGPMARLLAPSKTADPASRVSLILWGPPGTGKTTLAILAAASGGDEFVELSAVTAGVRDVRAVIEQAKRDLELNQRRTVLFIDEVHRFSKTQQDALLPAVENGWIRLIAATTENPSFAVIAPLLSRSLLVPLQPLTDDEVGTLVDRAVIDARGLAGAVSLTDAARSQIIRLAGGDARRALTVLETAAAGVDRAADASANLGAISSAVASAVSSAVSGAVSSAVSGLGGSERNGAAIDVAQVEQAAAIATARYDRAGDQHYDITSALIKSVRGSDVDAALHYLARMVEAGEDPRFIVRRLVILASEDIGMADPTALPLAVAAMQAVAFVGMPEARIILAQAVIHLALAPKSNRVYLAINSAVADIRDGRSGPVPPALRDASTAAARANGAGSGYDYPHESGSGIVAAQYAPEGIGDPQYYRPTAHGAEARLGQVVTRVRRGLGRATESE